MKTKEILIIIIASLGIIAVLSLIMPFVARVLEAFFNHA
jgi:hypothetical protein